MDRDIEIFKYRLFDEWLPAFCDDIKRRDALAIEGFKSESIKVTDYDAGNFIRALDSGVVKDSGGGRYRCEKSAAFEQIFWEGSSKIVPRPLTLWVEPVITIGTVARLGLDYRWPERLLCMQSKDGAFDFVVFDADSGNAEYIAGEVKKTKKELDALIDDLMEFGRLGTLELEPELSKKSNSFKKWAALQRCRAPLFWAVGPDDYTHLFSVDYGADHTATFSEVELEVLQSPIQEA